MHSVKYRVKKKKQLTLQEPWRRPAASLESLPCGRGLQGRGEAGFSQLVVAGK